MGGGAPDQLVEPHRLEALGAQAHDDLREGPHQHRAVDVGMPVEAVVQEDDRPRPHLVEHTPGDELRIDLGELNAAERRLVLGVTKDGEFHPALEVKFPAGASSGGASAVVVVHGDLHIQGSIKSSDVRTRTVTEEVAALLTGMVQAGIATGA